MALYLIESIQTGASKSKQEWEQKISLLRTALLNQEIELIEVQVSHDLTRSFFIIRAEKRTEVVDILREQQIPVTMIKPVRLVGDDLENVKAKSDSVNYLVEWNLPEGITMDQYLERKKTNSVHYQEVPEVSFSRTYVCEDMTKCLCFYDAPDEQAVKKARAAVKAPIDSITEISAQKK